MLSSLGKTDNHPNYLRRSASQIRADSAAIGQAVTVKMNLVDRHIRLAQYTRGPEIRSLYGIRHCNVRLRRVGYGYYSECFYTDVARAAMRHECRIERVQTHMISICENELASLHPKFIHVWEAILIVIFSRPESIYNSIIYSGSVCRMASIPSSLSIVL